MTVPERPLVAVVGGGLAGITAAIALRESGAGVVLLEARPRLGGATCSFSRGGLVVDNGQHVFLRCCTAYRGLLARLGMTGAVAVQPRFEVPVVRPASGARPARRTALRRTALPGPLHMGPALAGYRLLSVPDRLAAARAVLAMSRLDPADPALDGERLGDWLAARGVTAAGRRALWDLFTVSALNVAGDDANLALAATVVQTAMLGSCDAADIGVPAVPLGELHGRAAAGLLARLGAGVRLGVKVAGIEAADEFTLRAGRPGEQDGRPALRADAVILAVPHEQAARLLPAAAAGGRTPPWAALGSSPILNVHVRYDRQVMRGPFTAAVGSPVQWVFDRTRQSGLAPDQAGPAGQYLAVSVSAADDLIDVPAAKLREIFLPALGAIFPAAASAAVTDFFVTRERRATFRQVPGCQRLRPPAATALPGLALAGAWTDTGWPDTMEGAVRSGLNAAREVRRALRTRRAAAAPDPAWACGASA